MIRASVNTYIFIKIYGVRTSDLIFIRIRYTIDDQRIAIMKRNSIDDSAVMPKSKGDGVLILAWRFKAKGACIAALIAIFIGHREAFPGGKKNINLSCRQNHKGIDSHIRIR